MKNNFTANDKGASIEMSLFCDNDLSRIYFDENFQKLKDDKFYFTDLEMSKR